LSCTARYTSPTARASSASPLGPPAASQAQARKARREHYEEHKRSAGASPERHPSAEILHAVCMHVSRACVRMKRITARTLASWASRAAAASSPKAPLNLSRPCTRTISLTDHLVRPPITFPCEQTAAASRIGVNDERAKDAEASFVGL
jgi:hypothetical protein